MKATLPSCQGLGEAFYLSPDLRRELLLLMAEHGPEGIDEFVRRHQDDDSQIGKKVEKIRARLEKEAQELRQRLRSDYQRRRDRQRRRAEKQLEALREQERRLAKERQQVDAGLQDAISRRVRDVDLVRLAIQKPAHVPWWRRLHAWFRRQWRRLVRAIARLFGRRREPAPARGLVVGAGRGAGVEIETDIETALALNPELRRGVRRRLGATPWARARRMVKIMLGLEDYADVARRVMEAEAAKAAAEEESRRREQSRRLDDQAHRAQDQEREVAGALDEELERLRAAEAEDRRRLEDMLSARPAEDTARAVVDELEAGGFLRRIDEGVEVTGRFLESVASLVHAMESKGVGASHESPLGSSPEGDGILEKTPMLAYFEASHMDMVGTLVQARTRHPKVRHILDDDVLVHREKRTAVSHVVVVLDRSLSMEENDRMTAARRAALALHYATKMRGPANQIDFILMDTEVRRASLSECWEAKPQGFTNTGRALEMAGRILSASRANRKVLFLVTDGLPEAMTRDGVDVAGKPEEALKYALTRAANLKRIPGLEFRILLLEPDDPMFVTAAKKLSEAADGTVMEVRPAELAKSLLVGLEEATRVAA